MLVVLLLGSSACMLAACCELFVLIKWIVHDVHACLYNWSLLLGYPLVVVVVFIGFSSAIHSTRCSCSADIRDV